MALSTLYSEMLEMSDEQIIAKATGNPHSAISPAIYLQELHRRQILRQSKETTDLTRTVKDLTQGIAVMTVIITVSTVVNVALVAYSVIK